MTKRLQEIMPEGAYWYLSHELDADDNETDRQGIFLEAFFTAHQLRQIADVIDELNNITAPQEPNGTTQD